MKIKLINHFQHRLLQRMRSWLSSVKELILSNHSVTYFFLSMSPPVIGNQLYAGPGCVVKISPRHHFQTMAHHFGVRYVKNDLTREKLDELVNLPYRFVDHIEYGNGKPSPSLLDRKVKTLVYYDGDIVIGSLGLMAGVDIGADDLIGVYAGKEVNEEEKNKLLNGEEGNYLMELTKSTYVDAKFQGNETRFINHNCEGQNVGFGEKWIKGKPVAVVRATKPIKKGDIIKICYPDLSKGRNERFPYIKFCKYGAEHHIVGMNWTKKGRMTWRDLDSSRDNETGCFVKKGKNNTKTED